MKKVLLVGFDGSLTEESVRSLLERFGPIHRVDILRQGNANAPLVVVEMDIGDATTVLLTSRIRRYWSKGRVINAHALVH
jgi:hypothetical protein